MNFIDLLSLTMPAACEIVAGATGCLLVIGDAAAPLAAQLTSVATLTLASGPARIMFGLPVMTLPYPILVHSLMTERNTRFDQLSLFGWIEDNAILEPRAEVFGLTPFGDDPVLFIRDLDLDRPPECYVTVTANKWSRVAGVILARTDHHDAPVMLPPNDAALAALEIALPADAQPLLAQMRAEVDSGKDLRHVLRARRRAADPALMALCDGWRVLARACRFVVAGAATEQVAQVMQAARLDALRRW
jgi:hypothetical protein